jgi:hypothetical protein
MTSHGGKAGAGTPAHRLILLNAFALEWRPSSNMDNGHIFLGIQKIHKHSLVSHAHIRAAIYKNMIHISLYFTL